MKDQAIPKSELMKIVFTVCLLTSLIPYSSSVAVFDLEKDFPEESDSHHDFNISNKTYVEDLILSVDTPKNYKKSYNLKYSGNSTWGTTLKVGEKGFYTYSVNSENYSYPENSTFGFSIPAYNQTLRNISENFTDSNSSTGRFCTFRQADNQTGEEKDFTCEYENFQAWMMLGQLSAYYSTGNETFLNRSLRFATQNYGSSRERLTCSHSSNDFNCEDDTDGDGIDVSSGMRQGSLIESLWRVYSVMGNQTVRELAENYTQGSAESCDVYGSVWNKSFNCKTAEGQGSMILGYWTAYHNTGNETYRSIAENLSETNKSSPRVARGLWKGYQITGNSNYSRNASEITKTYLSLCPENCTEMEITDTFLTAWTAYKSTGDYGYYRHAVGMIEEYENQSCDPLGNDTSCSLPNQQGVLTASLWKTYGNQLDNPRSFRNPDVRGKILSNSSINFSIEMAGKIENPQLRLPGKNLTCSLGFFNRSCSLAPEKLANQSSHRYFFESNSARFPENGSFRVVTSFGKDKYKNYSRKMVSTNPLTLCSPWASDNDTTCFYELDQAFMIRGFNQFQELTGYTNYSTIRDELAYGKWDASNCNAYNNGFNCNSTVDAEGSFIQGTLMKTFYKLYSSTDNTTALEIARNYSKGHAEDCDIWNNDYRCNSTRGQAAMIQGYWHAYRITGNETYLDLTKKLSQKSLNYTGNPLLGSALWKTYAVTGNSTYQEKAENITDNSSCENCSIMNFSATASAFRDAYIYGGKTVESFKELLDIGTRNQSCNPIDGDYQCEQPREQGALGSIYSQAYRIIPVDLNASIKVEAPESVDKGGTFDVECVAENTVQDTLLYGSHIKFNQGDGLEKKTNSSLNRTEVRYNQSINDTATFEALKSGKQKVSCILNSKSNIESFRTTSVDVQSTSSSKDDSSGRGGLDGLEKDSFEPYRINYSFQNLTYRIDTFAGLKISALTKRDYRLKSSCFSGYRKVYQNSSVLKLQYSCNKSDILIVEKLPRNVTPRLNYSIYGDYSHYNLSSTGKENISVNYTGSAKKEEWAAPIPLILKEERDPLRLNVTLFQINQTRKRAQIKFKLNKKEKCILKSSKERKKFSNVSKKSSSVKLQTGNNTITLKCGELSRSFTAKIKDTSEKNRKPIIKMLDIKISDVLMLLKLSLASLVILLPIYKRDLLVLKGKETIVSYYKNRFFNALDNGRPAKAVEKYEKLKKFSESSSRASELIGSEVDLDTGVYLYLSLDAVKEAERNDITLEKAEDLINDAIKFAESNSSKNISRKIQQKLEEILEQRKER